MFSDAVFDHGLVVDLSRAKVSIDKIEFDGLIYTMGVW